MSLFERVFHTSHSAEQIDRVPADPGGTRSSLRVRLAPFVVYSNVALVMLGLGAIAPVLPDIQKEFDVSYAAIALAISAFAIGRLVTNLPAGYAAGKIPPVYLLMFGALAVAAGSLFAAAADGLPALLAGRTLSGIGSSITTTVGLTIVLGNAAPERRGRAGALFHSSIGGGALFGPGLGAILSLVGDWRTVLIGAGVAALVSFTLILIVAGPASKAWANATRPDRSTATKSSRPNGNGRVLAMFATYLAAFAIFFQRGAMRQTLVPLIAQDAVGLSTALTGVILMVAAAMTIATGPWVGSLTDRVGRSRILVPGLLTLAVGSLLLGFSSNVYLLMAGLLVTSLGGSVSSIPSSMIVDTVSASARGTAIGSYRVAGDGALALAPFLAGWIADNRGFSTAGVATSIFVTVAAVGVAAMNFRPKSR